MSTFATSYGGQASVGPPPATESYCGATIQRMRRALASFAVVAVIGCTAAVYAQRGADRTPARSMIGISGRVIDASGAPITGVLVSALYPSPERRYGFQPVNVRLKSETNERGEYVLEGLAPGEYYVIAVPHNSSLGRDGTPNRVGHANTFHPNATRIADAKRVRLMVATVTADITLAPASLAMVSGVVIAESGQPAPGGALGLARGDGLFGLFSGGIAIQPDGRFRVAGLQPGTYYFHYREGQWPPPRDVMPKVSGATVELKASDMENVRVLPIPVVRGSGRLIVEPASRSSLNLAAITVLGVPDDFNGNPGPQRASPLTEDLTFEFKTWPSLGRIRVSGLPPGWTVRSIRVNGTDVTHDTIAFTAGKDLTGIEVEVAKR
jgi:hypothetical protein